MVVAEPYLVEEDPSLVEEGPFLVEVGLPEWKVASPFLLEVVGEEALPSSVVVAAHQD